MNAPAYVPVSSVPASPPLPGFPIMVLEGSCRHANGLPFQNVNHHTLIISRTAPLDTPASPSAATESINDEKKSYEGEALNFPGAHPPPERLASGIKAPEV